MALQDAKFKSLGFQKLSVNDAQVASYTRGLENASATNPVLVLLHGYPESAYKWRHVIPLLPASAPLFVPDLPGYGNSPPIEKHDKLSVGNAILSALQTLLKRTSSGIGAGDVPIVLIGHDRGARVAHRLAVTGFSGFRILGSVLIDIVPTVTQWRAAQNPREIVGYFHWPFLANVEFATKVIEAYGGARFCEEMMLRWAGKNEKGLQLLKSDDSLKVFGDFFRNPSVVRASSQDYEAGATVDVDAQLDDQKAGRKITAPVLLIYSEAYLGGRYDVRKEWEDWIVDGVALTAVALGNGIGHFGDEEAPEETTKAINQWLSTLPGQL